MAIVRLAQARHGFDQIFEHRFKVRVGAADKLEYVAGRGLVFQRFLQVVGALTKLV